MVENNLSPKMTSQRELENWISTYLEYTEDSESPEQLHYWTGMSVLSTALRRQAFMDRGTYKLYPNLYIIIVGDSGKIRKSVAMGIGVNLLLKAVPDISEYKGFMKGRMTPEGLVKYMNRNKLTMVDGKDILKQESHTLIFADELATFFGYDKLTASRLSILLTETYGCPDSYPHTIKSEDPIIVKNLYTNLLSGTDPRNLKVLPEDAVGGLLGRTIFVTANKRRKKLAWPKLGIETIREKLIVDLFRISNLKGEFVPTKAARQFFADWYDEFSDREFNDPRLDAFHERAHDTALKVAMLLSVSMGDDLIVNETHMRTGIQIIENQIDEFRQSMEWAGTSLYAQNRSKFIDILKRHKGVVARRAVQRAMELSSEEIRMLAKSLEDEGRIKIKKLPAGEVYEVTPEEALKWKENK